MLKKSRAATGLLFIAAPAWAGTSLIAGQPLEYNHAYKCKGERIIVAHCRDEDDASFCQVVYPDRPYVNGNQVAPVEARGDVIREINACNKTASAPAQPPAHASVPAAAKGKAAVTPPGVTANASWMWMDYSENMAVFFRKEAIKRSGGSAQAWFTAVYSKTQDISPTIKGVRFFQFLFRADCAKGTFVDTAQAFFDDDGQLIHTGALNLAPTKPEAGTFADEQLHVVCGKPQKLIAGQPLDMDGLGLFLMYREVLDRDARQ
jgi:hypothetical protein